MSEQMMVATERAKGGTGTRGTFLKEVYRHREYLLLLLPALIIFVLFRYIPMAGIVIAFKKYTIVGGLFGSLWVGFTYSSGCSPPRSSTRCCGTRSASAS